MMNEDKILDYLDGALGDKESAELMHQLAVSPERRVILEQHLQLKNAISDARKPVPVPMALEARLAERLPVIANYNREIAGAALIGTARTPYVGRIAAGIAAFLLIGTALYFGVIRDGNSNSVSGNPTIANSNTGSSSAVSPAAPSALAHQEDESVDALSSATAQNLESVGSMNIPARASGRGSNPIPILSANDLPPVGGPVESNRNDLIQQEIPATETPQQYSVSNVDRMRTEPMAALSNVGEQRTFALRMPFEESSDLPFALRLDYGAGSGAYQVRETDASITTRGLSTPTVGIDYIVSPHIAFGLEGGISDVARVEEIATVSNDAELGITRVTVSHDIRSHSEYNGRAMFRYTLNPFDRVRIEGNIGTGAAFGDNISPLVAAGVTFHSRLTDAISLSVGPTWTGLFTTSSTTAPTTVDGPVAYNITDQAASTLFTPSFVMKVGLRIKAW